MQKHLDRHRGDVEESLAAVQVPTPLRQELRSLDDADVQASLSRFPTPSAQAEPEPLGSTTAENRRILGQRYQVLREHDKGGIGEVFVALDQELNREVALKEIQERHADDSHSRSRFVREAEITGGLEHPGIVPVYGLGQDADGRPFYAMRFIQGESLRDAIARYHRSSAGNSGARSPEFELRTLLTRFVAVGNTIAYAHSRGVIHRDLKPANIMLGKYGETLVVDWGMAKAGMSEPARSTSEGLPEPNLTPSLTDGIETQAALELGSDVEYWLADEPVSAHRELWPARSRRWMRHHRTLVSTAMGVLVIALLSVTVGLVIVGEAWDKETAARRIAEDKEEEARKQKEEARFNQYVAAMNLVQREYEAGNLDRVQELLAAQVPREVDAKDYRNFEWYYWQRMSHRELLILPGHKD